MRTRLAIAGIATAVAAAVYLAFVYGEYRSGFDRQAAGALHDVLAQAQEDNSALKDRKSVV